MRGKGPFQLRVYVVIVVIAFGYALMIFSWGRFVGESAATTETEIASLRPQNMARIARCSAKSVADRPDCLVEAIVATRESERAELELQAQLASSRWGFFTLLLGMLQFPVSIWGLIALFRSLKQTELSLGEAARANEIANDAVQRELRAYVVLDRYEVKAKRTPEGEVDHYLVLWVWKNVGATPARNLEINFNSWVWHAPAFPDWFPWPNLPNLWMKYTKTNNMLAPGGETKRVVGKVTPEGFEYLKKFWSYIYAWGSLEYLDVFDRHHRQRYRRRSNGYGFSHKNELEEIDFGLVGNDTGGDENADAAPEVRPPLPDLTRGYIERNEGIGWLLWLKQQPPKNWEVAPDGTPSEQSDLPFRLKPEEDFQ